MPELLLGLDAGTTTLTACLFTPAGALLSQASAAIATRNPAPGLVEQDAARIWTQARRVIRQALARANRTAGDVAGLGVTTQRTSLVMWDRKTGAPLSPLVVWSDLRGAARAAELQAMGIGVSPQQAISKLETVWRSIPDHESLLAQGRLAWGNIDSYLIFRLSRGAHVTDRSQAWPLGYLDLQTQSWNTRLMDLQGLEAGAFPTLCDSWGPLATCHPAVLGAAIPIAGDMADQQAAMVGQGTEGAGACKVTFGTSATVNVGTGGKFRFGGPTLPPMVLSGVEGETRFCIEGMIFTAGAALDWLRRSFSLGHHAAFEALAAAAPADPGLAVLPAFQGIGAPHGDLGRRGLISGLSLATTPGQIARAGLESIALRVCEVMDRIYGLEDVGPRPEMVRVDGGLTGNELLMQMQSDFLGLPVARHALREATACGAAICAGRGVGLLGPDETSGFVRHDRIFEPQISQDAAQTRLDAWRRQVQLT